MDKVNLRETHFDIVEILKKALRVYKTYFSYFIAVGLIYGFSNLLDSFFIKSSEQVGQMASLGLLINILITSVASLLLVDMSSQIYLGKTFKKSHMLNKLKKNYWRFIAVTMAQGLAIGLGLLCFIFPGVYFACIFLFADILVVVEDREFMDAFRESTALIKGSVVKVLLFLLTVGIIFVACNMGIKQVNLTNPQLAKILGIIFTVVCIPYYVVAQVELFYWMKKHRPAEVV